MILCQFDACAIGDKPALTISRLHPHGRMLMSHNTAVYPFTIRQKYLYGRADGIHFNESLHKFRVRPLRGTAVIGN